MVVYITNDDINRVYNIWNIISERTKNKDHNYKIFCEMKKNRILKHLISVFDDSFQDCPLNNMEELNSYIKKNIVGKYANVCIGGKVSFRVQCVYFCCNLRGSIFLKLKCL